MGLDVYLVRYSDPNRLRMEAEAAERSKAIWASYGKPYDKMTQDEKDEASTREEQANAEAGFVEDDDTGKEHIEIASKLHPEHMFKVGYFRSSYNNSGIERIGEYAIGERPLHYIFQPGEEYKVTPDWAACLERAKSVYQLWNQATKDCTELYRMFSVGNPFITPSITSNREAMEAFKKERTRRDEALAKLEPGEPGHIMGGSYGNRDGNYFLDKPIEIHAAIPVLEDLLGQKHIATYLVYKETGDDVAWYGQALEVVIETIEYVLAQENTSEYLLHWSG